MCSPGFVVVTDDGVPANKPADTDESIPNTGEFSKHLFCFIGGRGGGFGRRGGGGGNFVTELKHTNARQTICHP